MTNVSKVTRTVVVVVVVMQDTKDTKEYTVATKYIYIALWVQLDQFTISDPPFYQTTFSAQPPTEKLCRENNDGNSGKYFSYLKRFSCLLLSFHSVCAYVLKA